MKNKKSYTDYTIEFAERYYFIFLIIIIVLISFNVFYKLDETPIIHFDEARHGASAYEMLKNKEFIVNTFGYENDYWNLKPPLSFWMIMVGYKLLGFNILGLRLYSGISTILTVLIVTLFVMYKHGKLASLISGAILTTTTPFIVFHSARSADADALYVFLFTVAMISMMLINENRKFLYLAAFSAALSFLTKSWHGFNIVIIGALYIFISGTFFKIKLKEWVLFSVSYICPILLWVILRISKDGLTFLKGMVEYDLLTRSSQAIEGHVGDSWYYFNVIVVNYGYWFLLLIPLAIACLIFAKKNYNKDSKNYMVAIFLWIAVPMVIYTNAKTKIEWYVLPIYPVLAILSGIFYEKALKELKINDFFRLIIIVLIVMGISGSEINIYKRITTWNLDEIEDTLKVMGNYKEYHGYKIYTQDGVWAEQGGWQQGHIFAAELYADLIPVEGGFEAFLTNKYSKSLIMAPLNDNTEKIMKENNLKIVLERNGHYILSHNLN